MLAATDTSKVDICTKRGTSCSHEYPPVAVRHEEEPTWLPNSRPRVKSLDLWKDTWRRFPPCCRVRTCCFLRRAAHISSHLHGKQIQIFFHRKSDHLHRRTEVKQHLIMFDSPTGVFNFSFCKPSVTFDFVYRSQNSHNPSTHTAVKLSGRLYLCALFPPAWRKKTTSITWMRTRRV